MHHAIDSLEAAPVDRAGVGIPTEGICARLRSDQPDRAMGARAKRVDKRAPDKTPRAGHHNVHGFLRSNWDL
jgi:hypothetical protein